MGSASSDSVVRLPLIDQCLREQRRQTVVERFAELHDHGREAGLGDDRRYRDLIPLSAPRPGQQYGFQVDLDACTGCQACVTACHRMNGLDDAEAETWRHVGSLQGQRDGAPVQVTVTAACHHCADPACMSGCPVGAYEKDPVTGIVRHLDDQCIGCQYCTLTCPYEVPQYNERLGIVRKCDMCAGRLEANEAPACVQACPNEAISIQVVDLVEVRRNAASGTFLPGAPSPAITAPSTRYLAREALDEDGSFVPADFHEVRPAKAHAPLAIMLVLTQWSAGALLFNLLLAAAMPAVWSLRARASYAGAAVGVGLLALVLSTLHLGRPAHAWRALIGLRTSWLSREILAFGLFTGVALPHAAATAWVALGGPLPAVARHLTSAAASGVAAAVGAAGISCSVMIYAVTRKRWWSAARTGLRFAGTAALLGACSALVGLLLRGFVAGDVPAGARAVALAAAALGAGKLAWEGASLLRRRGAGDEDLDRTARLLRGQLRSAWLGRLALGLVGAVVIPLFVAVWPDAGAPVVALAVLGLASAVTGEIAERDLFFRAVSAPRMPGRLGP